MSVLSGIRVLDFTTSHGGSLGAMNLCDFGAEVIKVEAQRKPPISDSEAKLFSYINRGKKSVQLDIEQPRDRDVLLSLLASADVICEDLPCGYLDSLGLGYPELKKEFPGIIYVSLSAFGRTGPWKDRTADDNQLEAMSGVTDMTGFKDEFPVKPGTSTTAYFAAGYLVSGVMLALIHREKTREGQYLDLSALDCLITSLEMGLASYSIEKASPARKGNAGISVSPYDTFRSKDGYVAIGVSTNQQWANFCCVIGRPELVEDPRYDTNLKRKAVHVTEIVPIVESYTLTRTKKDVEEAMKAVGIPCGGIYSVYEAMNSVETEIRRMLLPVEDAELGTVQMPGVVIHLEKTPGEIRGGAPVLGADNHQLLNH